MRCPSKPDPVRWLLCASLLALAACSPSSHERSQDAVPVEVAQAVRKAAPDVVTAVGNVEAINSVAVKSRVDGQLLESAVRDGDKVTRGQLLFRIDPRPAQAALAQAQAALARDRAAHDLAQAQVDRYRPIAAQHFISADQMQQYLTTLAAAAASMKVDQANVEAAQLDVTYTDIHAPIDGRAGRVLIQPGNLIKANDTNALLTINQLAPIYVGFAVPGNAVDRLRAAQARGALAVRVSGDGIAGSIDGALAFIDNAVDPATNTVKLRAQFANADERLWPGQFVDVQLVLGHGADAITVPDGAVKAGPDGAYVFVIERDTAHQRAVTVARSFGGTSVIAQGLREGETVVTDGQSRLEDGTRVRLARPEANDADAAGAAR